MGASGDRLSLQPRSGADCRLVVSNDLSELERVGECVRRFARERRLSREEQYGLDLAVEEALSNVMLYAFGDGVRHDIIVEFHAQPDQVLVQIEDDGAFFNPLELPVEEQPRSLDEARPSGRGIPLMHTFMSELHYLRRDNRNVLTMILNCASR